MERNGRALLGIGAVALAVVASGSMVMGAEGDDASNFVASTELFELTLPAGWVADEHSDGGGISVSDPDGALSMNLTFIPSDVLQSGGVNLGAPAGAGSQAIAEALMGLLAPVSDNQVQEPAIISLADESSAVEVPVIGTDVEGALYFLEPEPGVTAVVSAVGPIGGYQDSREAILGALGSLQIDGGAEALSAVLNPPPLVDINIG